MKEKTFTERVITEVEKKVSDYSVITAISYGRLKSLYRKGKTITEYESLEQKQSIEASAKSTENRLKDFKEREYAEYLSCMDLATGGTKNSSNNISSYGDLVHNCMIEILEFTRGTEARELITLVYKAMAEAPENRKQSRSSGKKNRKSMLERLIISTLKAEAPEREKALINALLVELVGRATQNYIESMNGKKALQNIYSVDNAFIYTEEAEALAEAEKEALKLQRAEALAEAEALKLQKAEQRAEAKVERKVLRKAEAEQRAEAEKLLEVEQKLLNEYRAEALADDTLIARAEALAEYKKREEALAPAKAKVIKRESKKARAEAEALERKIAIAEQRAEALESEIAIDREYAELKALAKKCKISKRELELLLALSSNYNYKEYKKQVVELLHIDKSNCNKMLKNIAQKLKEHSMELYLLAEQNKKKAEQRAEAEKIIRADIERDIKSVKLNYIARKAEARAKALKLQRAEALAEAEALTESKERILEAEALAKALKLQRAEALEKARAEAEALKLQRTEREKEAKAKLVFEARTKLYASTIALEEAEKKAYNGADTEAEGRKLCRDYKRAKALKLQRAEALEKVEALTEAEAEKIIKAEAEQRAEALERKIAIFNMELLRAEREAEALAMKREEFLAEKKKARAEAESRAEALERKIDRAEALAKALKLQRTESRAEALERKIDRAEALKEQKLWKVFSVELSKVRKKARKELNSVYIVWHNFKIDLARAEALERTEKRASINASKFIVREQKEKKELAEALASIKESSISTHNLLLKDRV